MVFLTRAVLGTKGRGTCILEYMGMSMDEIVRELEAIALYLMRKNKISFVPQDSLRESWGGYYDTKNRRIVVYVREGKNPQRYAETLLHELVHFLEWNHYHDASLRREIVEELYHQRERNEATAFYFIYHNISRDTYEEFSYMMNEYFLGGREELRRIFGNGLLQKIERYFEGMVKTFRERHPDFQVRTGRDDLIVAIKKAIENVNRERKAVSPTHSP